MTNLVAEHRDFEPIFVDCSLEADDDVTKGFLNSVLETINYHPKGKYLRGVHSLLISLYEAEETIGSRHHLVVAIPANQDYWSSEDLVSRQIVRTLREKLREAGILTLKKGKFNCLKFLGPSTCDLFSLSMPRFEWYASNASISTRTKSFKVKTREQGSSAQRALPDDSREASDLIKLNSIIQGGSVKFGGRISIGGVSRKFSDYDRRRGGRFQGAYTNKPKQMRFQKLTIMGEAVSEVDISASNPTILAAIAGYKLPDKDMYEGISGAPREVTKALVVEMIGSGNCNKSKVSNSTLVVNAGLKFHHWPE